MSGRAGPGGTPPGMLRVLDRRRAGVLLHATSLPDANHGALGQAARSFVDWLAAGGFSVWQFLPLGPVGPDRSPYFARSNHAGDPALVDLATLAAARLIDARDLGRAPRAMLLSQAAQAVAADRGAEGGAFARFRRHEAHWLDDYALFMAIQGHEGGRPWWQWPEALRRREPAALGAARAALAGAIAELEAGQYFFHSQWHALRAYAAGRGVRLFGDVPIYVAPDSVEVWAHPELFQLDAGGEPTAVAGVPPDYFSADGQRWGNPLYRWEAHEATGFAWWLERLRAQFELFDLVRIDHFRGLEAYWAVPAGAPTAATGEWRLAPGEALLRRARATFGRLEVVAEDLGVITPEVEALRDGFGLPGMRIAQFGFDGDQRNVHVPHNWTARSVGYTGTHDNDTSAGWYAHLDPGAQQFVADYLGASGAAVVPALVRSVLASVALLAVVPMQDLLGLGTEARMNLPGTTEGNWGWRFSWAEVPATLAARCERWNRVYGRA
ncbi:MAG TPA: 4-alpha-glucanotransferase [Steroidobacteraceae bacterium]|nr:4-alpha-glucanotransferase [Steroidobacteraceae bacterium]